MGDSWRAPRLLASAAAFDAFPLRIACSLACVRRCFLSWSLFRDCREPRVHRPHQLVGLPAKWARDSVRYFFHAAVRPGHREGLSAFRAGYDLLHALAFYLLACASGGRAILRDGTRTRITQLAARSKPCSSRRRLSSPALRARVKIRASVALAMSLV